MRHRRLRLYPIRHAVLHNIKEPGERRWNERGFTMLKMTGKTAAGMALGLLVVTGCTQVGDRVPYYNESLSWFSRSEHDPEVRAIEERISPPGQLGAPAAPAGGAAPEGDSAEASPAVSAGDGAVLGARNVRRADGHAVRANPPPGMSVSIGSSQLDNKSSTTNARASGSGLPLVGIRNSLGSSVTWRSPR